MTRLSNAARVALAPAATFRALAASRARASWSQVLAGPLLTAVVLGMALSVAGTHVASVRAVIGVALFWSFVPAVQLFTAWMICRRPPRANVTPSRAIELLFLAHLPYSLWLVGFAAGTFAVAPGPVFVIGVLASAVIPVVWTPVLVAAFSRAVLGCTPREARRRTIVHQAITWAVILTLAFLADQSWARSGGGA